MSKRDAKMEKILVTNPAAHAIRRQSIPFKPIGPQLINGSWLIPVTRSLLEEIEAAALPDELISDTIIRTFVMRKH